MKLAELELLPQTGTVNKDYDLGYFRKSTDEKDRQVQSIPDQKNSVKHLESGRKILRTFEESRSAKKPGRTEFNAMLDLIEKRRDIRAIIAYDFSRLSRNPLDTARLQWMLQTGLIDEIITTQRIFTELDSDLLMSIEGGMSNKFVRDLSRVVKRGLASRLEAGVMPTLAPLGYQNDRLAPKGSKTIIPHPIYFPLVKKVFSLALTGRYSMAQLAIVANKLKINSSRGKALSMKSIYKVLRNPFFCGRFVYNGVLYAGSHKSMISEAQFDRIQEIFDNPSKPRAKTLRALNGVFTCGTCGTMITFERHIKHYKNGTSQTFGYYRCGKKRGTCNEKYIPEAEMEKQIIQQLERIKLSKVYVDWAIKWLVRANEEKEQLRQAHFDSLNKAYNDVEVKLTNLFDMKISPKNADGVMITDEDYIVERQKLLLERKRISKQQKELEATIDEFYDLSEKAFDFASRAKQLYIKDKTMDGKKKILLTVGSNLSISGQEVQIQLREPFKLVEEAMIKLKNREIPVEPESLLLGRSNRPISSASLIMSG